ncbi:hypothetical protein ACOSP7_025221 [Xanthoceras sorbifolium]
MGPDYYGYYSFIEITCTSLPFLQCVLIYDALIISSYCWSFSVYDGTVIMHACHFKFKCRVFESVCKLLVLSEVTRIFSYFLDPLRGSKIADCGFRLLIEKGLHTPISGNWIYKLQLKLIYE